MSQESPKAFISYSWSSTGHQALVGQWAEQLVSDGVDVVLDIYDLKEGHDKFAFMERMVTDRSVTPHGTLHEVFSSHYIMPSYAVSQRNSEYPHKEITFIAEDHWPAKGSGIMIKRLPWPFHEGEMTFYLEKDTTCNYTEFFKILSYNKNS